VPPTRPSSPLRGCGRPTSPKSRAEGALRGWLGAMKKEEPIARGAGGEAEMRSLPLRCSRRSGRCEVATDRDEDLGGGEGHRQTYEDAPSGLAHVSGNLE